MIMETMFKLIDAHPTASSACLWIMAALCAWSVFNYNFTTV